MYFMAVFSSPALFFSYATDERNRKAINLKSVMIHIWTSDHNSKWTKKKPRPMQPHPFEQQMNILNGYANCYEQIFDLIIIINHLWTYVHRIISKTENIKFLINYSPANWQLLSKIRPNIETNCFMKSFAFTKSLARFCFWI